MPFLMTALAALSGATGVGQAIGGMVRRRRAQRQQPSLAPLYRSQRMMLDLADDRRRDMLAMQQNLPFGFTPEEETQRRAALQRSMRTGLNAATEMGNLSPAQRAQLAARMGGQLAEGESQLATEERQRELQNFEMYQSIVDRYQDAQRRAASSLMLPYKERMRIAERDMTAGQQTLDAGIQNMATALTGFQTNQNIKRLQGLVQAAAGGDANAQAQLNAMEQKTEEMDAGNMVNNAFLNTAYEVAPQPRVQFSPFYKQAAVNTQQAPTPNPQPYTPPQMGAFSQQPYDASYPYPAGNPPAQPPVNTQGSHPDNLYPYQTY